MLRGSRRQLHVWLGYVQGGSGRVQTRCGRGLCDGQFRGGVGTQRLRGKVARPKVRTVYVGERILLDGRHCRARRTIVLLLFPRCWARGRDIVSVAIWCPRGRRIVRARLRRIVGAGVAHAGRWRVSLRLFDPGFHASCCQVCIWVAHGLRQGSGTQMVLVEYRETLVRTNVAKMLNRIVQPCQRSRKPWERGVGF
jgi:hypothetical protein